MRKSHSQIKTKTALVLLLLLFVSQTGYYFIYAYQQYELREEMRHALLSALPISALEVFDADANRAAIQWEEDGKEFYLGGQLYDVAYTKNVNGKELLYCLNDNKEQDLRLALSKLVSSNSTQNGANNHSHNILKFQLPDCIISIDNDDIPAKTAARQKQPVYADVLPVGFTTISTPPPDLIF